MDATDTREITGSDALKRRLPIAVAALLLVALLAGLALALADAQQRSIDELRARFADRAQSGAGVAEGALISFAPQQAASARQRLSGRRVSEADLLTVVEGAVAVSLYDDEGELIVTTGNDGVTDDPRDGGESAYYSEALVNGVGVSDLLQSATPELDGVIRQAVSFISPSGRRVLVSSFDAGLAQSFLGGSLSEVGNLPGEQLAIVDARGGVLAGDSALTQQQLASTSTGSGNVSVEGTDFYYVKVPIPRLSLGLVSTAPESTVVEPISGSRTLQWLLLAALALISLAVLYLLVRVAGDAARLERRRREAEDANLAKSQFLASMSHELRTPLNGIIGFTELMYDEKVGEISKTHKEYLGDVLVSARHLLGLINEVLDLSRIESGRLELTPERLRPGRLIADTIEATRMLARERGLEVGDDGMDSVPEVLADPARLRQVLLNFLSNALKFTPPGGRIVVRLLPAGEDHFRIEVADTGIGIDPADQARVFDDFEQAGAPLAADDQGSGLGLAVTQRLVAAMGGEVGLESASGVGSTFWVELPVGLSAPLVGVAA